MKIISITVTEYDDYDPISEEDFLIEKSFAKMQLLEIAQNAFEEKKRFSKTLKNEVFKKPIVFINNEEDDETFFDFSFHCKDCPCSIEVDISTKKVTAEQYLEFIEILKGKWQGHHFYPGYTLFNSEAGNSELLAEVLDKIYDESTPDYPTDADWFYVMDEEEKAKFADYADYADYGVNACGRLIDEAITYCEGMIELFNS